MASPTPEAKIATAAYHVIAVAGNKISIPTIARDIAECTQWIKNYCARNRLPSDDPDIDQYFKTHFVGDVGTGNFMCLTPIAMGIEDAIYTMDTNSEEIIDLDEEEEEEEIRTPKVQPIQSIVHTVTFSRN